ncbi:hypothetical protein Mgra_00001633 [Meloidogyne graminicola]|uniref:Glypican-6 n=1 Tax=Meloidogyne graminicola TaxID=189291 RepID=A0A8T0A079_9BILA|nr:hypothetical protein Mgra_00001633 [Meloidogyne graminicola]
MIIITQTTHFSTKIITIFMTSIFPFLFVPTMEQSTCAFLKQKYPRVFFENMPDEPKRVYDLTFCRSNTPTCCTSQIEKEFTVKFKTNFKEAFNHSMAALRRIFRRTYGQFYIQNRQIFNKFVNDSMNVFEQGNGCFVESLEQLFKRIFLAEFSFLNPMHKIDKENTEKQHYITCISSLFPVLRPFGFGPEAIVQLTGRNFSSPKNCLPQLTRMRHCGVCSNGDSSFQNGPCPHLCQKVYKQCINELIILDEQWRIFIDILIELSSYLLVHNPYIVFRPLPAQISDAIMYYQERGEIISNQIILRCFEEKFEKLIKRKKRQNEETDRKKLLKLLKNNKNNNRTLLNIRGLWNSFPRLICREGGIQAKEGLKCWNGGDFYFNEENKSSEIVEMTKLQIQKTVEYLLM